MELNVDDAFRDLEVKIHMLREDEVVEVESTDLEIDIERLAEGSVVHVNLGSRALNSEVRKEEGFF